MNCNFPKAEAEAEEISSLSQHSQHSQHSQQSYVSLSTEGDYNEHDECEEHPLKHHKKSRVWDHFTHPTKVKGMLRSTCNHCRYYSIFISIMQIAPCISLILNTCIAEYHWP
jgi:hypothetical protein